MALVLGFPFGGTIFLAANNSTPESLVKTERLDEAMSFACPNDALVWIERLAGKITDKFYGHVLYLYADHDLSIGPMGKIHIERLGQRKDKTWAIWAQWEPIPAPPGAART